ncbi:MAG: DUF4360 domain-containing protein [Devosia sp.]
MKKLLAIAAILVAGSFGSAVQAQDDISLGDPSTAGTGCPAGTVAASLTEDGKSLSIAFDSFVAEAGGATNKTFDRKVCNVSIPVHVPQGLSISVLGIDYRGYNNIPAGANTQFNVEYFFAGVRGPTFQKTFTGVLDDVYTIHNELTAQSIVWSKCGADVILRTNPSIRVTTKQNKQAIATVDSEDVSAAIIYSLQWKSC